MTQEESIPQRQQEVGTLSRLSAREREIPKAYHIGRISWNSKGIITHFGNRSLCQSIGRTFILRRYGASENVAGASAKTGAGQLGEKRESGQAENFWRDCEHFHCAGMYIPVAKGYRDNLKSTLERVAYMASGEPDVLALQDTW